MDAIAKRSGGQNLVGRPQARAAWQPAATVAAHEVEVLTQDVNPVTGALLGAPVSLGRFHPEARVRVRNNPDSDKHVRVYAISYAADGTPHASSLEGAVQATVPFQRETDAPEIGQNKPATAEEVEIGITGHTRFARFRRVTVSANADMSDPLATYLFDSADYGAHELPRYFTLSRDTGVLLAEDGSPLLAEDDSPLLNENASTLPVTVFITVAHNGGAAWTPESNVLEVTFAGLDGSPGSPGDFDPIPRDRESLGLIV